MIAQAGRNSRRGAILGLVALIGLAAGTRGGPRPAPTTRPTPDVAMLRRDWERAAADLRQAEAAAHRDVPGLTAAEADLAAARDRAARAAERTSQRAAPLLGDGPEPPMGHGPKNWFEEVCAITAQIEMARQVNDPIDGPKWRRIWGAADGLRTRVRRELAALPPGRRATTTQLADVDALWDLYRGGLLRSIPMLARARQRDEAKLADLPGVIDQGRAQGVANAAADLAEAYAGVITPPPLSAARSGAHRAYLIYANAQATTRLSPH